MPEGILPQGAYPGYERIGARGMADLYEIERQAMNRAVESRQLEFATGRSVARSILNSMGMASKAIPVGSMREPVWPNGIVGSITHEYPYCLAVLAHKHVLAGIGIDLTPRTIEDKSILFEICSANELEHLRSLPDSLPCDELMLVFSIKEAVYKCLYPMVGQFIDFKDVEISLDPGQQSASIQYMNPTLFSGVTAASELCVRYGISRDYIFSAVSLPANDDPVSS